MRFLTIFSLTLMSMTLFAQQVKTSQHSINLGQVVYRMPTTGEFELTNQFDRNITIRQIKTSCGCTRVEFPRHVINKGESYKVYVTYDAKQMGHFEKQIGLYFSDNQQPTILTIKGVVVDEVHDFNGQYTYDLGDLSVDKIDIEFDDIHYGDRPFEEIYIRNNSKNPVHPFAMHLPNYLQAEVSPSTILPGRVGVMRLTLISEQIKSYGLSQTSLYLGANPGDKVSNDKEINISTILLPKFDELTQRELENTPRLELSSDTITLDFSKKKKVSETITLTNVGPTELEIYSLQMFTDGLKVSLGNTKLQPKEETKLKVTASKKHLKAVNFQPRILMITNDPKQPKRIIVIK